MRYFSIKLLKRLTALASLLLFFFILQPVFAQEISENRDVTENQNGDSISAAAAPTFPTGFTAKTIFSNLSAPTAVRFANDGRVFISEKSGIIKVFDNLSDTTPTVFADLRSKVMDWSDRGLLGLALHPDFPNQPYVYALYTHDAPIGGTAPVFNDSCSDGVGAGCVVSSRLSRLTASGNSMTREDVLITDWCQQYPSHSVGTIAFGQDGYLYASGGDGASYTFVDYGQQGNPCNDPTNEGGAIRSQDLRTPSDPTSLDGTVIRVDPMTGVAAPGNPLIGGTRSDDDRIIAYGLRNPFRFTVKPGSNELWIGDVGWGEWEEINRITNPTDSTVKNFGWPCYEGNGRHSGYDAANISVCENLYSSNSVSNPFYVYNHDGGSSAISGVSFYNTGNYPSQYRGALFFTDYNKSFLKAMLPTNGVPDPTKITTFASSGVFAVDLQAGPNGDIFYADIVNGQIVRVEYFSDNTPPNAVIKSDKTSGPTPLTVQFDGSGSSDPNTGDTISYAWDLNGDGQFTDSTAQKPLYTYNQVGSYTVGLRVTDNRGAQSTSTIKISVGNSQPTVKITAPTATTLYKIGDTMQYSGSATDTEDGSLPASALSWQIITHHCAVATPTDCHQHVTQTITGSATGSFTVPDHEYPSHLEFKLTATDRSGLTGSQSVIVKPRTVNLSMQSSPSGLQLKVYGVSRTTPFTQAAIVNSHITIDAPTPQTLSGSSYTFRNWSDNGTAQHEITVPSSNATYTATFSQGASVSDNTRVVVRATDSSLRILKSAGVFQNLGGTIISAPDVAFLPSNTPGKSPTAYYVAVGGDNNLWARTDILGWQRIAPDGTYCTDKPAVLIEGVEGNATITVGCKGRDASLMVAKKSFSSGMPILPSMQSLGGKIISGAGPAVAKINNVTTYYVVGTDSKIWYRTDTAGFRAMPWTCIGHPAVETFGSQSYFACHGSDHALWYSVRTGTTWGTFTKAGGALLNGPAIVANNSGIHFYVEGTNNGLFRYSLSSPTSGFVNLGGKLVGGVGAGSL